jgi:hypothetical protein
MQGSVFGKVLFPITSMIGFFLWASVVLQEQSNRNLELFSM